MAKKLDEKYAAILRERKLIPLSNTPKADDIGKTLRTEFKSELTIKYQKEPDVVLATIKTDSGGLFHGNDEDANVAAAKAFTAYAEEHIEVQATLEGFAGEDDDGE